VLNKEDVDMKIEICLDELQYYEVVDGYFDLKGSLLLIPTESLANILADVVSECDLYELSEGITFELSDNELLWDDQFIKIDKKQYVRSNCLIYKIEM
jgi:hypothetical protein